MKSVVRYEKSARLAATAESYSAAFDHHARFCETVLEEVVLGVRPPPDALVGWSQEK